ncbi:MAG: hypothetical protein K2H60_08625 [Muribaculaceae bacterium]|nr:hypothetical protein [Muribaculaceae bacterium]
MTIEQKINYQLNKYPKVKKLIKRVYQLGMYVISPKIKSVGEIIRVSPDSPGEYFFGYYDKSPWSGDGRYMLCMKAKDTWSTPDPLATADVLLIDTYENYKVKKIATTHTWNVQQGCMAQWLGPDFNERIIYNDMRDGRYCSVILNVKTGEEIIRSLPVYTVSSDGRTALSLDFSRLHNLRPGYGYSAILENTLNEPLPDATAIWRMSIDTGKTMPLLRYADFADFETKSEMVGAVHKVNHLMLNPSGKRFMVLHRWFKGHRKYTRLITCNIDGSDMYNLSDDDMVSHCYWKNDQEILAFENKNDTGIGYYLMMDKTQDYVRKWPELGSDGHPSYSPDGKLVVMDTYPDSKRLSSIFISDESSGVIKVIGKVFSPFKYDNDTRCDLHPRWSRDGKKICFDGVFEGKRGLYMINIQ